MGTVFANLAAADFGSNQLVSTIPSEIGLWKDVRKLTLADNVLSGSLPSELGLLSNVLSLRLQNNLLSGAISSELGNLKAMDILYLQNNVDLSGRGYPTVFGNWPQIVAKTAQESQIMPLRQL